MEKIEQMGSVQADEQRIEKIITHEGIFHTDEVFGEAILKDLFPESMELKAGGKIDFVKYIRTRDKGIVEKAKESGTTMVIDIGGEDDFERFNMDHHQPGGAGARENGVEYATAGLVWKNFGKDWIKYVDVYSRHLEMTSDEIDTVWDMIDQNYVQYIDANDTGQMESITCTLVDGTEMAGKSFSLAEVIRLYNIDTHDGNKQQDRFNIAVEVMRSSILSAAYKYMELIDDLRTFQIENCQIIGDGRALIIDQMLKPITTSYLFDHIEEFKNVEYAAVLSNNGGYSIVVVPIKDGLREYRNPNKIPAELRLGSNATEINNLLSIKNGVTFVHTAGFFASCKNTEAATKFLEYCTK